MLLWSGLLVLGGFGAFFTFANYPLFGAGIVLVAVLLTLFSERRRRKRQRVWERERRQRSTRSDDIRV